MTMVTDGPDVVLRVLASTEQYVWSSLQKLCWNLCLFVSWCWLSVPRKLSDRALWTSSVQWQWIIEASPWDLLKVKPKSWMERPTKSTEEFDVVFKQVTNLAGSGHTESRDGCDLTTSFSQPTGVCCEKDSRSIFVIDSSSGRLRLITSVQVLIKYLQNPWLFLSALNLTGTKTRSSYDGTVTRVQQCYAFQEEASLKVQGIKGSTSQTQGPDGTLSAITLNSVKMILEGLSRLKTKVMELNPNFIQHVDVESLIIITIYLP